MMQYHIHFMRNVILDRYPDEWYMSIMSKPCYVTMAAEVDNRIVGMIIGEVKKHINCNQEVCIPLLSVPPPPLPLLGMSSRTCVFLHFL